MRKIESVDVNVERCAFTFQVPTTTAPNEEHCTSHSSKPVRPLTASRTRISRAASFYESGGHSDAHRYYSARPRTSNPPSSEAHPPSISDYFRESTIIRKVEPPKEPDVTRETTVPLCKYKLIKQKIKNELYPRDVKYVTDKEKEKAKGKLTLKLSGKEADVNAALVVVYELANEVEEGTVQLEKPIMSMVSADNGKKLQQYLDRQGTNANIVVTSREIKVFTVGDATAAISAVKDAFSSATVNIRKGFSLSSTSWSDKKFQLEMGKEVIIKENQGYLQVQGYKQAVNEAKVAIECFMDGKAVVIETVPLEHENVFRYFSDVRKDALNNVKMKYK